MKPNMDIIRQGKEAYLSGRCSYTDNPYRTESFEYRDWNLGFMQGVRIKEGD